jgi:UDP:flavonoid glycosyltransferase YjiC (YdhE family)
MPKILVYTTNSRGHLYPIVPTLDELARRGYEVAVRTLDSQVAAMRERGFTAEPIAPAISAIQHDDYTARSTTTAIRRSVKLFAGRADLELPDLQAAIAAEQPDLLLIDGGAWGGLIAAEQWGGPWAQWQPFPLPVPDPLVPPFGPGFAPAGGPLTRLRDRILRPLLISGYARLALPPINAARAGAGLAPLQRIEELWTAAPALLYTTAEPFEYPRAAWPANVAMIGPGSWDPPADPPEWLAAIDRPIVLVTTSSEFQDDGKLVEVALLALADEPVHVVATLPAADPADFASQANAHVLPFVSHGAILERAACAITHGGMGATQKALAAGVPVCVVPFGRDQLEVGRRAVIAEAGTTLKAGKLDPERLRAAVREAMTKTAGAQRVAAGYRATGEASTGADRLDALVLGRRTARSAVRR